MGKKIYLGDLLLDNMLITQDQLNIVMARQKTTGEKFGKIVIDLDFIKEEVLLDLLSKQLDIDYVDLKNYSIRSEVVHTLPEFYARRYRAIVLANDSSQGLLVGMVDPLDLVATDELTRILKRPFKIALVREDDLLKIVDMIYRHSAKITNLAEELSAELTVTDYDIAQLGAGLSSTDAPVVKLLQTIFEDAIQVNATDIHIEPDEKILRIRVRIDSILHEQIVKEKNIAQALTLRIKLMAGLNIAEKRLPQDGRFSLKIRNLNFDVRLSTLPVQFGESVVMRLLNQSGTIHTLDQIGMPKNVLQSFRKMLTFPHGIILVTGPTGSGKTTTLYGALNELNSTAKKIITVEDPVEYRIPRVNQVQVQPKINLTFANILRSILRQDPDIIMIGELRDQETVSIALRAALTGHLVLATVHTNDSISSIVRLLDMGAEDYILASVLRAVIAQRLVRKICKKCIKPYTPTPQELLWVESLENINHHPKTFMHGTGCTYCHNTGYYGRTGIFEFLEINPTMANNLRDHVIPDLALITQTASNFESLTLSALDLIAEGVTTIAEIMRITGEDILVAPKQEV